MKLSQKYSPRGANPQPGALGGIWMSVQPSEVAAAIDAGTGPGVPDDSGTPQAGTIVPGQVVVLNSAGTLDLMTSQDMAGGTLPQLPFVVHSGDDDYSGSLVGECLIYHGGARLDTEKFNGIVFAPSNLLTASAGNFALKVAADGLQIIAMVGPRGMADGVLDVVLFSGICGYND